MTNKLTEIQRYFIKKATEKAKLNNITVDGKPSTIIFSEYQAPEKDIEEFKALDGTDGHFYFITIVAKTEHKTYRGTTMYIDYTYLTTKEEGNEIYKAAKQNKSLDISKLCA